MENNPLNLRELISQIVLNNVKEFNRKSFEPLLIKYLSGEDIEERIRTGKVGFRVRRKEKQVDAGKALDIALLAFQDGIYKVFIGENEVTSLDAPLLIQEGDVLTFIRFTMFAGRLW